MQKTCKYDLKHVFSHVFRMFDTFYMFYIVFTGFLHFFTFFLCYLHFFYIACILYTSHFIYICVTLPSILGLKMCIRTGMGYFLPIAILPMLLILLLFFLLLILIPIWEVYPQRVKGNPRLASCSSTTHPPPTLFDFPSSSHSFSSRLPA